MNEPAARDYLGEVLALDPLEHTGRILELRALARASAPDKKRSTRDAAEAAIGEVREKFYELGPDEVQRRLSTLALDDHPDLARSRARLLRVNELRPQLEALNADKKIDRELGMTLRRALVAPAADGAGLRDDSVRSAGAGARARARDARRFAKRLRKRYPEVAALEADWLSRLLVARRHAEDSTAPTASASCSAAVIGWLKWVAGCYFALLALTALFALVHYLLA